MESLDLLDSILNLLKDVINPANLLHGPRYNAQNALPYNEE